MIVADSNLIAYLLIPGQFTADAERVMLRDGRWAAPVLWRSEVASILLKYVRAGSLTVSGARQLFSEAESTVVGQEFRVDHADVLQLAERSGCSTYHCEYVLAAQIAEVPLVTADKRLLSSFPGLAISPPLFAPP